MSQPGRGSLGSAFVLGRDAGSVLDEEEVMVGSKSDLGSPELSRALAEVKGQAQFLLYLADQIEDSLQQLGDESEPDHGAFLCKILGMYSSQLESKHQGLGDKIAETCQELYVAVREFDV